MLQNRALHRRLLSIAGSCRCAAPAKEGVSAPSERRQAAMPGPAFGQVWGRTDQPGGEGRVARSWMWGPHDFYSTYEPYAQGPGGGHLVCYFDKSRMEVNNPTGDRTSPWFVTNGLLVVEMISGRIQVGDTQFMQAR